MSGQKRKRPLHALKWVNRLHFSQREGFIEVCSFQLLIELSPNGMPVIQGLTTRAATRMPQVKSFILLVATRLIDQIE
jgi:hypothetical protein